MTLSTYAHATGTAPEGARRAGRLTPRRWAIAASATLTASVLAGMLVLQPWRTVDLYDTGIGEQRTVMLQDGTRLSLNTATRMRVELGSARRTVNVEGGEALFEVAKDASRPFVVQAAGTEVVATGTVFGVRVTPASLGAGGSIAVTLVEGQVIVRGPTGSALASPVVMVPGQRVRLSRVDGAASSDAKDATSVDRPRMDQVLAWKRGEAIFDNASLLEAVAEMNRYSATPITVAEADIQGSLRVSGVFRTGDNASFARAVAALHGLVVREGPSGLELVPRWRKQAGKSAAMGLLAAG